MFLSKSKTKKIKLNYFIVCRLLPTMNQFRITLSFAVRFLRAEDGYGLEDQKKKRKKAFERTDRYYEDHSLEGYVKTFRPMDLVESMIDGEVVSVEWDPTAFKMHMTVETEQSEKQLREDLEENSLEDNEYEACGETGWILFTRGPNGEVFEDPTTLEDYWVYALLDYRTKPVVLVPLITQADRN